VTTTHTFNDSLAKSAADAQADWWGEVYTNAFGPIATMTTIEKDGWAQRGGIDRVMEKHRFGEEAVRSGWRTPGSLGVTSSGAYGVGSAVPLERRGVVAEHHGLLA
jgi:hypothetical protein